MRCVVFYDLCSRPYDGTYIVYYITNFNTITRIIRSIGERDKMQNIRPAPYEPYKPTRIHTYVSNRTCCEAVLCAESAVCLALAAASRVAPVCRCHVADPVIDWR